MFALCRPARAMMPSSAALHAGIVQLSRAVVPMYLPLLHQTRPKLMARGHAVPMLPSYPQAGIVQLGGLGPLLELLESKHYNLQVGRGRGGSHSRWNRRWPLVQTPQPAGGGTEGDEGAKRGAMVMARGPMC